MFTVNRLSHFQCDFVKQVLYLDYWIFVCVNNKTNSSDKVDTSFLVSNSLTKTLSSCLKTLLLPQKWYFCDIFLLNKLSFRSCEKKLCHTKTSYRIHNKPFFFYGFWTVFPRHWGKSLPVLYLHSITFSNKALWTSLISSSVRFPNLILTAFLCRCSRSNAFC